MLIITENVLARGFIIINPRRMHRRVTVVVLCVCLSVRLSVNSVTASYFVCESQARCYMILYGVSNACIVWISLKTLCSPVLAAFADSKLLDFARASDSMT